jgi:hypothetical protein
MRGRRDVPESLHPRLSAKKARMTVAEWQLSAALAALLDWEDAAD